jgi:hypothetical protein
MIYRALACHSAMVRNLIGVLAVNAGISSQSYFENNIPDHLKDDSANVLAFIQANAGEPSMAVAVDLGPQELYLKNLLNQPQAVISYIRNRVSNYPGLSAQELFDKVPDNLKDNPQEILDFLSKNHGDTIGMEVSHIQSQVNHPHLAGDSQNIVLETTLGNPNQVRQGLDMSDIEVENILAQAKQRALMIESQHLEDSYNLDHSFSNPLTSHHHETVDLAFSQNYDGLADSLLFGLESLAATLGVSVSYAVIKTYSPRIIATLLFIIRQRERLVKEGAYREKFVRDYLMPLVQAENADQLGVSFIVGLILACIPGIRELLLAYGLVSLCKLALPHVERFITYLTQRYPRLAKLLHWVVGGISQLVTALHATLAKLWQIVEQVADTAWQTVKQGAKAVAQTATKVAKTVTTTVVQAATVAKDCLVRFFNWSWGLVKGLFSGNPQPSLSPA